MKKNHGFTLIQLMVSTSIIGTLSCLAYYSYYSYLPKMQASGTSLTYASNGLAGLTSTGNVIISDVYKHKESN